MKNYTITVNGNVYDVTVEENGAGAAPVARPAAAPKAAPAAAPAAPKAAPAGGAGSIEVKAGAAGKVFKIEANVGQAVKKGDAVVIIEAMKMEIPVVAPETTAFNFLIFIKAFYTCYSNMFPLTVFK